MSPLTASIAIALCVQVALSDLYARRVDNRVLLLALAAATAALVAGAAGTPTPMTALLGFVAGFALLPFHAMRWMGAGDVKFFATLGFVLGWQALLPVWLVASLLAGVHAMVVLGAPRLWLLAPLALRVPLEASQLRLARSRMHQRMREARAGRIGIPYAAYLAAGALMFVAQRLSA